MSSAHGRSRCRDKKTRDCPPWQNVLSAPVDPFLLWLEATPLSVWMRESPFILAFPGVLCAHAIGMGLAAGINAAMALRLLGVAPGVPIAELRRYVPLMWFGFWLNAVSGVLLLVAYPTKALTNPVFFLKLTFILIAMLLFVGFRRRVFADPGKSPDVAVLPWSERRLKLAAAAALVCWAGAITAGRLLAYTYNRMMASW